MCKQPQANETIIMKTQLSILLLMMILVSGCEDSGTNPPPHPDELLLEAIVGVWSSNPLSYAQYFADGTFTSKVVVWRGEGPPDTLTTIKTGNYTIIDGILYRSGIRTSNFTSSGIPWGYVGEEHPSELTIRGDTLFGTVLDVYSKTEGSTFDLAGSWSTVFWITRVPDTSFTPVYEGRVMYTYTFFPDSHRVKIQSQRLDPTGELSQPSWTSYTYDPPVLSIGISLPERAQVLFKAGKMRWYRYHFSYQLLRVR